MQKRGVFVPVIEISELAIDLVDASFPTATKINPTQIVRASLLLAKQSKLTKEQVFSLIGQSVDEDSLIESLEVKK